MKWNHLPNAGGLYDQDPELLRKFEIIFAEIAKYEKEQAEKREAESRNQLGKVNRGRGGPSIRGGRMRGR